MATNRSSWCRPLFRWAGSKRALLPLLLDCIPQSYGRYIEPFAGSACLFFALKPAKAVLGDFNADLMDAYRVIVHHPRRVTRAVASIPDSPAAYYNVRSMHPESLDDIERAARFTYLNRYCFNGVYRTNRSNHFNVPRGIRPGKPLSEAEVYRCSFALRSANLITGDFSTMMESANPGDFVYLDPPYSPTNRTTFGEYGYGAFGASDVARLIQSIKRVSSHGTRILLSYTADNELLYELRDWSVVSVDVQRQVGGGSRRRASLEILASNYIDLDAIIPP